MPLSQLRARWQQSRYPEEIRITDYSPMELAEVLDELTLALMAAEKAAAEAAKKAAEVQVADLKADPPRAQEASKPKPELLDLGFVVGLCNDLARLQRNAQALGKTTPETKEMRSIKKAIERVDEALRARGIEFFEKSGSRFDPRDVDFEPKGQPVAVPGLTQSRIGLCECPVVKLNGKIIQRAQGIVEIPAAGDK